MSRKLRQDHFLLLRFFLTRSFRSENKRFSGDFWKVLSLSLFSLLKCFHQHNTVRQNGPQQNSNQTSELSCLDCFYFSSPHWCVSCLLLWDLIIHFYSPFFQSILSCTYHSWQLSCLDCFSCFWSAVYRKGKKSKSQAHCQKQENDQQKKGRRSQERWRQKDVTEKKATGKRKRNTKRKVEKERMKKNEEKRKEAKRDNDFRRKMGPGKEQRATNVLQQCLLLGLLCLFWK